MHDPASFCHKVVHKKHIFLQALPLEDKGCVQGNLTGASLHNTQEAQCVGHGVKQCWIYSHRM